MDIQIENYDGFTDTQRYEGERKCVRERQRQREKGNIKKRQIGQQRGERGKAKMERKLDKKMED